MEQGALVPVAGRVEVVRYLPDSAELLGRDGNLYYIPMEDLHSPDEYPTLRE